MVTHMNTQDDALLRKLNLNCWQNTLLCMQDNQNMTRTCRKMNIPYRFEIFRLLINKGLIKITSTGRDKIVTLTPLGQKVREALYEINTLVKLG